MDCDFLGPQKILREKIKKGLVREKHKYLNAAVMKQKQGTTGWTDSVNVIYIYTTRPPPIQ